MDELARTGHLRMALATDAAASSANWPMFGHDPARSGVDAGDTILTRNNVSKLVEKWQISLGGQVADSTPIFLAGVTIKNAKHRLLYQTAKNGETLAIEAYTGKILWTYSTSGPNITDSTPVADPSGTAIYVAAVDGKIHKLNAATGAEITGNGFPATLTLIPNTEKNASSLNLANGYLYATTSGYLGDAPYYDGHVIAVNLTSGSETVFNSLCSDITTLHTSSSPRSSANASAGKTIGPVHWQSPIVVNGWVYCSDQNGKPHGIRPALMRILRVTRSS